jgi:hypothetical protein
MGHPGVSLARHLDVPPATVWNLLRGSTVTVSPDLDAAVRALYERIWNLRPPERTGAERRAAAAARARAAANGWPAPMGLDDDRIDDPAAQPRSRWRPATGTGVAEPPARRAGAGPDAGSLSRASRGGSRSSESGHVGDARRPAPGTASWPSPGPGPEGEAGDER